MYEILGLEFVTDLVRLVRKNPTIFSSPSLTVPGVLSGIAGIFQSSFLRKISFPRSR